MAHKATTWAWEVEGLSIPQKFLLVALADMADEAFSCFPGQALLARMTGAKGKRSVVNNLAELERLGYIERARRNRVDGSRTSDRFVLQVGFQASQGAFRALGGQGASDDTSKVHLTTPQGAPDALEENPQRNHQTESPGTPVVPTIDVFDLAWSHWPKKADKKTSRDRFQRALKKHPQLAADVIRFGDAYSDTTPTEFVPGLATWILRERWDDALPTPRGGSRPAPADRAASVIEMGKRLARGEQKSVGA